MLLLVRLQVLLLTPAQQLPDYAGDLPVLAGAAVHAAVLPHVQVSLLIPAGTSTSAGWPSSTRSSRAAAAWETLTQSLQCFDNTERQAKAQQQGAGSHLLSMHFSKQAATILQPQTLSVQRDRQNNFWTACKAPAEAHLLYRSTLYSISCCATLMPCATSSLLADMAAITKVQI